jgi:hypothetical protein
MYAEGPVKMEVKQVAALEDEISRHGYGDD